MRITHPHTACERACVDRRARHRLPGAIQYDTLSSSLTPIATFNGNRKPDGWGEVRF
ncbi:hypothetical protein OH76DRAFT_1413366 [Lentinus brumalis]|uniref:Uncharacterized protein n=1 Tax=Lentinus brumalis TaxID=2498619 RepID=A0A371CHM1_9APHY|nr:hypothetical protein OH76DRAFT_1413366 [Polyporus brumalis]